MWVGSAFLGVLLVSISARQDGVSNTLTLLYYYCYYYYYYYYYYY